MNGVLGSSFSSESSCLGICIVLCFEGFKGTRKAPCLAPSLPPSLPLSLLLSPSESSVPVPGVALPGHPLALCHHAFYWSSQLHAQENQRSFSEYPLPSVISTACCVSTNTCTYIYTLYMYSSLLSGPSGLILLLLNIGGKISCILKSLFSYPLYTHSWPLH